MCVVVLLCCYCPAPGAPIHVSTVTTSVVSPATDRYHGFGLIRYPVSGVDSPAELERNAGAKDAAAKRSISRRCQRDKDRLVSSGEKTGATPPNMLKLMDYSRPPPPPTTTLGEMTAFSLFRVRAGKFVLF